MEFTCLVFTRMPGESYRRRLRSSLLYLCYSSTALIDTAMLVRSLPMKRRKGLPSMLATCMTSQTWKKMTAFTTCLNNFTPNVS